MSAIPYGHYVIILVQLAADEWRADIRRLDGRKIKAVGGTEFDYIPGKAKFSVEEAVAQAKRLINAGGMS